MAVNVFCGHQVAPVDETRHHFGPKAPVMLYPRGQRGRGGMNGSGIHCGEQLSHTALHELRRPEYAERITGDPPSLTAASHPLCGSYGDAEPSSTRSRTVTDRAMERCDSNAF